MKIRCSKCNKELNIIGGDNESIFVESHSCKLLVYDLELCIYTDKVNKDYIKKLGLPARGKYNFMIDIKNNEVYIVNNNDEKIYPAKDRYVLK